MSTSWFRKYHVTVSDIASSGVLAFPTVTNDVSNFDTLTIHITINRLSYV